MSKHRVIFSIEAVPGDVPTVVEQPNGDLLVPASVRQLIGEALQLAEQSLDPAQARGWEAFRRAQRLLAVEPQGWQQPQAPSLRANLLKEYPLK